MNTFDIPLPKDTKDLFKKTNTVHTSNPYLTFNRFVWGWDLGNKSEPKPPSKNERPAGRNKIKLKDDFLNAFKDSPKTRDELKAVLTRQSALLNSLKKTGNCVKDDLNLSTEQRLVVGLGGKAALEIGLTLHPLYGFPYIPASTVKGGARSWAEQFEEAPKEELLKIFGSDDKFASNPESQLGAVTFLDALPLDWPELDIDIMNPHYPDYYKNAEEAPGDWQNPVPITFITVAPGTQFRFNLASRNKDSLDKAVFWLTSGLTELGIGAKTSSGYGYFKDEKSFEKRKEPKPEAQKSHDKEPEEKKDKPKEIPKFDKVSRGTSGIVAEVVQCNSKPILVRLMGVKGIDKPVQCAINNLDAVKPGQKILITVTNYDKKRKIIRMTRFDGYF